METSEGISSDGSYPYSLLSIAQSLWEYVIFALAQELTLQNLSAVPKKMHPEATLPDRVRPVDEVQFSSTKRTPCDARKGEG